MSQSPHHIHVNSHICETHLPVRLATHAPAVSTSEMDGSPLHIVVSTRPVKKLIIHETWRLRQQYPHSSQLAISSFIVPRLLFVRMTSVLSSPCIASSEELAAAHTPARLQARPPLRGATAAACPKMTHPAPSPKHPTGNKRGAAAPAPPASSPKRARRPAGSAAPASSDSDDPSPPARPTPSDSRRGCSVGPRKVSGRTGAGRRGPHQLPGLQVIWHGLRLGRSGGSSR